MPWKTPTLEEVRSQTRDNVTGMLRSGAMVPNSILRVMSDANAGLAYLVLLYIDWLAKQLLPDTAETEWLDRHAGIWVGGRKSGSYAGGTATFTGIGGTAVPVGTIVTANNGSGVSSFQTTSPITAAGTTPSPAPISALDIGSAANLPPGTTLTLAVAIAGIDSSATVVALDGGTDQETDDELRVRVLDRIRMPPMGGDADDYVQWVLGFPGVTRAWSSPLEMGIGTVTVRFMMDDLRATSDPMTNGFPLSADVTAVQAFLDSRRPVAVKDFFVAAPVPEPINFTITGLSSDTSSTRAAVAASVTAMLHDKAAPAHSLNGIGQDAQTIYSAWVSDAVLNTPEVDHFDLTMTDHVMPDKGRMAVLGTITWA